MYIDRVAGKATHIAKIESSAFVTSDGFYQIVMPLGMKNSASTFQRFVNMTISGIEGFRKFVRYLIG